MRTSAYAVKSKECKDMLDRIYAFPLGEMTMRFLFEQRMAYFACLFIITVLIRRKRGH